MPPRNNLPYLPSESLRLISCCPVCNSHYNPMAAQVLEENEEAHLIHIECRKCGSSIVALVLTGGMGISSVGLITDLTSQDVLRFKHGDEISSDDVLDFHLMLENDENIIDKIS